MMNALPFMSDEELCLIIARIGDAAVIADSLGFILAEGSEDMECRIANVRGLGIVLHDSLKSCQEGLSAIHSEWLRRYFSAQEKETAVRDAAQNAEPTRTKRTRSKL